MCPALQCPEPHLSQPLLENASKLPPSASASSSRPLAWANMFKHAGSGASASQLFFHDSRLRSLRAACRGTYAHVSTTVFGRVVLVRVQVRLSEILSCSSSVSCVQKSFVSRRSAFCQPAKMGPHACSCLAKRGKKLFWLLGPRIRVFRHGRPTTSSCRRRVPRSLTPASRREADSRTG